MRNSVIVAAGAALLAGVASGATVKIEAGTPQMTAYNGMIGGVFKATTSEFGVFSTFCVETTETVRLGHTYNYTISTYVTDQNGAGIDYLSSESAWLYKQFRTGAITLTTKDQARDFQVALWFLEDELTAELDNLPPGAQAHVNAATGEQRSGLYGVRVMNLFTLSGDHAQDQLVLIPLPAVPALAGLGLAPVVLRRRRA